MMWTDWFDLVVRAGLLTSAIVVYLIFFAKSSNKKHSGWNYLKYIAACYTVNRWKRTVRPGPLYDEPRPWQSKGFDGFTFKTSAPDGTAIVLTIKKLYGPTQLAEVYIYVKLLDGTYKVPNDSGTSISPWEDVSSGWRGGGLKVEILEPQDRCRISFNGLLLCNQDGVIRHVKFNFIWASASKVTRYPKDWSNNLVAESLVSKPYKGPWKESLNKCIEGSGSWSQFGALQGRFQAFEDGKILKSQYLRCRGVKKRYWMATEYGPKRAIAITAAAKDGTVLNLQGFCFNDITQCITGTVRLPNFSVQAITSADLDLKEFCETSAEIPKTYSINIKAGNRCLKVILRIPDEGSSLISGIYQEHEIQYRMIFVEIYGEHGTGLLELQYERKDKLSSPLSIKSGHKLRWVELKDLPECTQYCVGFEECAASCVQLVGGKGASLALLASVQHEEDYQVPPGFCITTRALDKFLDQHPDVIAAIKEIEASAVDYDEVTFKDKCQTVTQLFLSKEISGELKDEIIKSLEVLKANCLSTEPRYAVRSSGVGEDGEALSAAGQNHTELGVRSSRDVLHAVQACWASMFAFNSAYYRRQNGQPCCVQGGVVVQELVEARAAGVMFTSHPQYGDPSRLLLTANYGLGESVVSGMVEPDTVEVKRSMDGTVSIAHIEVGSKAQRVVAREGKVESEDVCEGERKAPCLSEEEIMKLARLGMLQEQLWGAGRDIEFAIGKDGTIYLLQARPITSLEAWTEEELLHELDFPVMSDDELITFANVGEVLPKPFTALSYDLVISPLERGISALIPDVEDKYCKSVVVTHNRGAVALYNSVYRRVPNTIDVNLRMLEMSIHGHRVANDAILSTALHRRTPARTDRLWSILDMIKNLFIAKWRMNETVEAVTKLNIDSNGDILDLCKAITQFDNTRLFMNHGITSVASTFTQFIAMSILLEGKTDFSPEQCSEISAMLNSGDVLSAEVPQALATLALMLEESGRVEEFRKQDPKIALQWLEVNLPSVYERVSEFLEQHGYRAIMEFDLSTKPWALVPEEMMKVVMQVVPDQQTRPSISRDEVIDSLKTPQKPNTRKALRWILPLCHRTVRYRESTKANVILAVHKLRLAALRLGQLMVRDWYLPSAELVFHFRTHELRTYVQTRDPVLLKKAVQRRNYYDKWAKFKFAELNKGWVEPLTTTVRSSGAKGARVTGTSVCGGEVIGRACVVRDLAEIGELRSGDILITASTDIGWSPYFPLLAGIVTELGGLISHGAVIAREYGLPCVVGAGGATNMFSTGDTVRLTAEGIVETISVNS
ncbi:unnamed protein product [Pieris brassicae]|uniref:Phosphoenolpyruvate synthase n=1 Tax=Pieris brassicae TaxID=7116 RepID=A0A9P0XCC4_PIEBR|nr:unnamed protein product [Pieris brassicae]